MTDDQGTTRGGEPIVSPADTLPIRSEGASRRRARGSASSPYVPKGNGFTTTQSCQSATKTLVSCGFALKRFEHQTSFFPSGLNMGKPSKSSWASLENHVTRS